mmetsp:Transcript_351/g.941  ORF Transcript_351/g.941 Transcript_351/m.941 type:complete len:309 (+) Transcript_351:69-995(+)
MCSDQPVNELVWLPCNIGGGLPQDGAPSEPSSLDYQQHDGATPQRRKGQSLPGLPCAWDERLRQAQQQFWCQQMKVHDQVHELQASYASLWLQEIRRKEEEVARQVRLLQEERKESEGGEEAGEDQGDGDEDMAAPGGPPKQSCGPVDSEKDRLPESEPAHRVRGESDVSSTSQSQAAGVERPVKALTEMEILQGISADLQRRVEVAVADPAGPSRRHNVFFIKPLECEDGTLCLPNFSPGEIFLPTDAPSISAPDLDFRARWPGQIYSLKQIVALMESAENASRLAEQAPLVEAVRPEPSLPDSDGD